MVTYKGSGVGAPNAVINKNCSAAAVRTALEKRRFSLAFVNAKIFPCNTIFNEVHALLFLNVCLQILPVSGEQKEINHEFVPKFFIDEGSKSRRMKG